MGTELLENSMIHFICFYLKFFYKPRPNIPVFQYSIIPFSATQYSILPVFQYSSLSPDYCVLALVKVFIIPVFRLKRTIFYWKEGKTQS